MNTELKNTIAATDKDARYDESAKRLLGQKNILAYILVKAVDEFKGMNPKDVVSYIVGAPYISKVPIEPGLTNIAGQSRTVKSAGSADKVTVEDVDAIAVKYEDTDRTDIKRKVIETQRIVGFNTESSEIHEGLIRFDIVFYVRMKDGISQIIVNVEAQQKEPTEYEILNRAIFYVSRLISSQKERDFANSRFDDIHRVYSIWVCMGMKENTMSHIHFVRDDILGSYNWKGKLDLANIVMLGLSDELPEHDEEYELHRLLGALLSNKLSVTEKLTIIETEYEIPVEEDFREDVSVMCNLSQGIKEAGIEIGRAEGRLEGRLEGRAEGLAEGLAEGFAEGEANIIRKLHMNGFSLAQIASVLDKKEEDIQAIIEETSL